MKAAEILVVDDEPEMANLVADIAKSRGHRATCAFEPAEAMRLVEDGGFDLVVTDVRMPNVDGIELRGSIRESPSSPSLHSDRSIRPYAPSEPAPSTTCPSHLLRVRWHCASRMRSIAERSASRWIVCVPPFPTGAAPMG
jgi:hypothetical protein